jgi:hypothetical protein
VNARRQYTVICWVSSEDRMEVRTVRPGCLQVRMAIVPSESRTVSGASQVQARPAGTDALSEVQIGSLADGDVLAQAADIAEAEGFPQTAADSIRNGTMSVRDFLSLLGKVSGMESMPAENAAESTTVPETPADIKGTGAAPADGTDKTAADVTDNVKTAAMLHRQGRTV